MGHAAKIACSIDAELLARVESMRQRTGESRSAFITRALVAFVKESSRVQKRRRYVEAYRERPETDAEVRAARKVARRTLSKLAW